MATLEFIATFIQSIPEVVWAALLGSILTLLGAVLTNRHHRAVQLAQLEHESRERDKQRKFDARVGIYLAAAAEMAKAQQVLGDLPNLDFTKENVGELLTGFIGSANQALLIASDEAAEAINEFLSAFFTSFFYLLPRVSPVHDAKSERDIQDSLYQVHQSEINRILATMTHINETHNYDAIDWDTLNQNLEFNQGRAREAADLRSKAWNEINQLNLEFMDEVMGQSKNVARALLPALVAIRSDLEIATDIELYREQLERRLVLMDSLIGGLKDSLRQAAT